MGTSLFFAGTGQKSGLMSGISSGALGGVDPIVVGSSNSRQSKLPIIFKYMKCPKSYISAKRVSPIHFTANEHRGRAIIMASLDFADISKLGRAWVFEPVSGQVLNFFLLCIRHGDDLARSDRRTASCNKRSCNECQSYFSHVNFLERFAVSKPFYGEWILFAQLCADLQARVERQVMVAVKFSMRLSDFLVGRLPTTQGGAA